MNDAHPRLFVSTTPSSGRAAFRLRKTPHPALHGDEPATDDHARGREADDRAGILGRCRPASKVDLEEPLDDPALKSKYRVHAVPISTLNRESVAEFKLSPREADRCKNFFALGLIYWLYERSLEPTLRWIRDKFAKNPAVLEANTRTLKAG